MTKLYSNYFGSLPLNICDEQRNGLASTFTFRCPSCGYLNKAETSKQHRSGNRGPKKAFGINTRVTLGCLHAGIGQTHINNILCCMNIPTINSITFKQRERLDRLLKQLLRTVVKK